MKRKLLASLLACSVMLTSAPQVLYAQETPYAQQV